MSSIGHPVGYDPDQQPVADGYARSSQYLSMDDGCRIAIDILRPTKDGALLPGPLPTLVQATGYRRAYIFGESDLKMAGATGASWKPLAVGERVTGYEKSWIGKLLVDHGYNLVCMDLRGTGASFGDSFTLTWRNSADVATVIEWIPQQAWATDKVGMFGSSWEATIQLTTLAYQPKHLAAVVPAATSQGFSAVCDNGLMLHGFYFVDWTALRKDQENLAPALPVDGDKGEALFLAAQRSRADDRYSVPAADTTTGDSTREQLLAGMRMTREPVLSAAAERAPPPPMPELGPLRDSLDEVERINATGCAIMLASGWWDITFNGHVLDFYRALTVPKRLIMGPWHHLGTFCTYREQLRWFDRWLKGIDNGIDREPPFVFGETDAFGETNWLTAATYPLPESQKQTFYLCPDRSLGKNFPATVSTEVYTLDYGVTLGTHSRSRFFFRDDKHIIPPPLDDRAARCLSFTTEPFERGIALNGRAELFCYLSTSGHSGALFATLEEILADGRAVYFGEGNLNFFHRRISDSVLPHDGRAFHSQTVADLQDVLPGREMEVALEFYPLAWRINAGSRIRLTLAGADADNFLVIPEDPAPQLTVRLGGEVATRLYLPVVEPALPQTTRTFAGEPFEGAFSACFIPLEHTVAE